MYQNFANIFFKLLESTFQSQKVSFNKKHRVKSIRLALLRRIPLLCTPVSAIFVSVPKFVGGKKGNRNEPNRTEPPDYTGRSL